MNKIAKVVLLLSACICLLGSCLKTEDFKAGEAILNLPSVPYTYDSAIGNNYIATLGRVMFYDSRLSVNNSIACGSCHKQARAFADDVPFSSGYEGKPTVRNSLPIQDLVRTFGGILDTPIASGDPIIGSPVVMDTLPLFWDGREKLLKAMVLRPIANHVEMGITDLDALAVKLGQIPDYQNLFTKAYGSAEVTQMKIADALSQFLMNIRSNNSRFATRNMSTLELKGLSLFEGKYNCNNCHQIEGFAVYQGGDSSNVSPTSAGFVNIGLERNYKDEGRADVTGNPADVGKFKIPTLRNVALTAPYMHDGRFSTLEEVLEHYSSGVVDHPNLDRLLRNAQGQPRKMNISDTDKEAIIAFLNALTDYTMITDPRFSNPFVTK